MAQLHLYIGTYTRDNERGTKSEGIYVYTFDTDTGELAPHSVASNVESPSFLAIDRERGFLYCVNETAVPDDGGTPSGGVSAFAIDADSRELTLLNSQPTSGGHPCHVAINQQVHAGRRFVFSTNYGSGSVVSVAVDEAGRLDGMVDFHQHEGSGPNAARQEGPHAHSITLDPGERFAFVCDLGMDQVVVYEIDWETGKLNPHDTISLAPGAGPRHFAFHPTGERAYVINELDSTVTSFTYNASAGKLTTQQTITTLPAAFDGENTTADLHVTPDGRFLFGSNRGDDSIAVFRLDAESGEIRAVGHQATQGRTPRNFAVDPSANFLLVANQDSDNVVVFRIDVSSGILTPTGHEIQVPMPVCLKFVDWG